MRAAVGPDYPVLIKMNSEDFVPGGLTVDDMLESAALIAEAGVDAIELSGGTSLSGDLGPIRTRGGIPQDREAYYQEAALRLKQTVRVPVMLVGGIRSLRGGRDGSSPVDTPTTSPCRGRSSASRTSSPAGRAATGPILLPLRQPLLLQGSQAGGHVLRARGRAAEARGPAPARRLTRTGVNEPKQADRRHRRRHDGPGMRSGLRDGRATRCGCRASTTSCSAGCATASAAIWPFSPSGASAPRTRSTTPSR